MHLDFDIRPTVKVNQTDAVRGAGEVCNQNVLIVHCGRKPSEATKKYAVCLTFTQ